jgi:hypothetical protein
MSRPGAAYPLGGSGVGPYFGNDFRAAYLPGATLKGNGQAVGLLEFDGYYASDVSRYESNASLPSVPLNIVLLDGLDGSAGSNNVEPALDIEVTVAMAPGLSQIVVYEGGYADDILNQMAVDNTAAQLSSSWSWGAPDAGADQIFQEFAAQGQSFFQASGDNGAYSGSIDSPAEDPYITVVGATTLTTSGSTSNRVAETAWNWYTTGSGTNGTGGGTSTFYSIPDWQRTVSMATNGGSKSMRNLPDVAMVGDQIWVNYNNGSAAVFGGTSVSTPLWAAFTALINEEAAARGRTSVGFVNPALYGFGAGTNYAALFHDITTGNNTNPASPSRFQAVAGYDLCTGWGTPSGQALIDALAGSADALRVTPGFGFLASGLVGGPFTDGSTAFILTNTSATPLDWTAASSVPWLGLSASGGSLAATGTTASVTASLTGEAAKLAAGSYAGEIWFTNVTGGTAQSRQFNLLASRTLVVNGDFESGSFTPWVFSGDGAENFVAGAGDYPDFVHSGSWGACLGQVGLPLATLTESISTTPGQSFLLSFWLSSPANPDSPYQTTPNEFIVAWNEHKIFEQLDLPVFAWTNLQFVVTAKGATGTLEFGFRDDPSALGLDDINLLPLPLPAVSAAPMINGTVSLTWNTLAGAYYQIQYLTELSQTGWTNLGGPIQATNASLTVVDSLGPNRQRFYRVVVSP